MNRRTPTRIAAAWLLLLFLLVRGVDAFGLHRCPLHEAAGSTPAHSMHAGHGSPGAAAGHASDPHTPCNCVGMCCIAATGVVPPPESPVALRAVVTRVAVATIESPESVRPLRAAYLLPYGQAPPLLG
jgi:hypothetical protein